MRAMVVALSIVVAGILSGCAAAELDEEYRALDVADLEATAQTVVQCMEDAGFPGHRATFDGSIESPAIPDEQVGAARAATDACLTDVGWTGSAVIEPTKEQLEKLFNMELNAAKCLRGLGHQVSEPPSLQAYADAFNTPQQWHPWTEVGPEVAGEFDTVGQQCPDPMWFYTSIVGGP